MSIPTSPATWRFASVTNRFPGPTILSTRGIVGVPYARAAIACAPPTRNTRSTPASRAAASTTSGVPPGGVTITISPTPATLAGSALIRTVDG